SIAALVALASVAAGTTVKIDAAATSPLYSFAIAWGAIFVVMVLSFRSVKLAILAFIGSCLPLIVGAGTLGLIGRPLDPSVVVAGAIALGISVTYTVYHFAAFLAHRRFFTQSSTEGVEQTLDEVGRPVFFSS